MSRRSKHKKSHTVTCEICKLNFKKQDVYPIEVLRDPISRLVENSSEDIDMEGYICIPDMLTFRSKYLEGLIKQEVGSMTELEEEVLESLEKNSILTENINELYEEQLTFGQRAADLISSFGGSWRFVIIFMILVFVWMGLNSFLLMQTSYDPYPYILLNLILSCLAAIQAPIIMMSQNRHAARDRLQAENDYQINLKAEIQIRHLNLKIDKLMKIQWQRLLEIQHIQTEFMQDILEIVTPKK